MSDLKYEHYLYLQKRGKRQALYDAGISCLYAHDLWTLSEEVLRQHALAFSSTSYPTETTTIVIGNYDRVSQPGSWGHEWIELTQITYGHSYRWDRPTEEQEIENTVTIPGGTLVYLLPRLTENTAYIFTETEENKMNRAAELQPTSKIYGRGDRPLPTPTVTTAKSYAEQGLYLSLGHSTDSEAWFDKDSTFELVRNITKALGTEEGELELVGADPWADGYEGQDHWQTTYGPAGDEQVFMVSAEMTEETALQQINVLARIAQRLGERKRKENELYAQVDEFRKKLKPNAKKFTPTAELPEQDRQFQIDRFKRVTGWVETELNKDKEDPTA